MSLVARIAFFLGNSMDFLAIPIALLGLAVGSMYSHFVYKGSAEVLVARLRLLVLPLLLATFLLLFYVANTFFSTIHVGLAHPRTDLARLVVYSAIFLPPYIALGAMLASLFGTHAERIGRLYFFDLAGAALGCVLTPLLLTWVDLWAAILGVLAGGLGLWIVQTRRRLPLLLAGVTGFLVVAVLASRGDCFREHPDPRTLARSVLGDTADRTVNSVEVRWNQIARTALLRVKGPEGREGGVPFIVVQDNGLSNVYLNPWEPDTDRQTTYDSAIQHALPWDLGLDPERILVMFAGAGRDMATYDLLARGRAEIVGVEINPTVIALSHSYPARFLRLVDFHARPNIHLEIEEGRDFLNRAQGLYDHIHVANNGAVTNARTGHSRKFLDTFEAMAAYLDHLAPGGLVVFCNQPIAEKIPSFIRLFEERGLGGARQAMIVVGRPDRPQLDTLVVKPGGFDAAQVRAVLSRLPLGNAGGVLWAPGHRSPSYRITDVMHDPGSTRFVDDDRPFVQGLELSEFTLRPTPSQLKDRRWVSSWVKVLTTIIFGLAAGLVAVAARVLGGKESRVPTAWVAYLLASGVGYMAVEIGLIAKTELFVGNPLYAIALNLAAFLAANAVGALLQDRHRLMRGPGWLVVGTVLAVGWGVAAVQLCNLHLLSLPLPAKAVGVLVATFPAGVALGTFYPYCVQRIVAADSERCVPMTYGLTALASVLGSVLAMTAIIELGFNAVIAVGAGLYALAGVIAWVEHR